MTNRCECHRCIRENNLGEVWDGVGFMPLGTIKMILCPVCGYKRCPKANDHRNACTGSNDPHQPGSRYE